jgi:hypothetical protein
MKVKYTHSVDTSRNSLNIDLEINNERPYCKIGTLLWGVLVGESGWMEEMKERDYGWWVSYTYTTYNNETSCNYFKWGREGFWGGGMEGVIQPMYKAIRNCCNESVLYNEYIQIEKEKNSLPISKCKLLS